MTRSAIITSTGYGASTLRIDEHTFTICECTSGYEVKEFYGTGIMNRFSDEATAIRSCHHFAAAMDAINAEAI